MKLIFCPLCSDVVSLHVMLGPKLRSCRCGESHGRYVDSIDAEISGKAIPIGFANHSFFMALQDRPEEGAGSTFTAFVIPKSCPSVKVLSGDEETT